MSIVINNCSLLKQKIDKAIKQLPYKPTREQFCKEELDKAVDELVKQKAIKL